MKKKNLAAVLAAVMVMSSVPVTTGAAAEVPAIPEESTGEVAVEEEAVEEISAEETSTEEVIEETAAEETVTEEIAVEETIAEEEIVQVQEESEKSPYGEKIAANNYGKTAKDQVTWTVYDSKPDDKIKKVDTLVISGTGAMKDVAITEGGNKIELPAWHEYADTITKLVIEDGITYVGSYAFDKMENLQGNLTLPASVTAVGPHAFHGCSGLSGNLALPASVTAIGDYAFSGCSGLNGKLTLPSSVTSIGAYAFSDCSSLTGYLWLPDSITIIQEGAFRNCQSLNGKLTIPVGVVSIGKEAFKDCEYLTGNLRFDGSTKEIGEKAFYGCTSLKRITLGNNVKNIGLSAFGQMSGTLVFPYKDMYERVAASKEYPNLEVYWDGQEDVTHAVDVIADDGMVIAKDIVLGEDASAVVESEKTAAVKSGASLTVEGGLTVDGKMKVDGNLNIYGSLTVNGELDVQGNLNIYGNLIVKKEGTVSVNKLFRIDPEAEAYGSGKVIFSKSTNLIGDADELNIWVPLTVEGSTEKEKETLREAGSTVTITADTKSECDIFQYWTSNQNLEYQNGKDQQSRSIQFLMPKKYVDLKANIKDDHEWETKARVDQAPTCKKEGSKSIHCKKCDVTKNVEKIPATGHKWDKGKVQTAATSSKEGTILYTCTVCGETKTEKIPKLDVALTEVLLNTPVVVSGDHIKVSWKEAKNADGYLVYRKENGQWKKVADCKKAVLSWTDTSTKVGYTYQYTVKAYRKTEKETLYSKYSSTGVSLYQKFYSNTIKIDSLTVLDTKSIKVKWKARSKAAGYSVLRKTPGGTWKRVAYCEGKTYYTDKTCKEGITYQYTVRPFSYNGSNKKVFGSYDTNGTAATAKMAAVKFSAASKSTKKVTITWTKKENVDGYYIYMKTSANGKWKLIKKTGKNIKSYTKTSLVKGKTYYFTVRAYQNKNAGKGIEKRIFSPYSSKGTAVKVK